MDDLIDRAKAIKAIEDMQDCYNGFSGTYDKAQIIGVLEEVPSAERKGHWIDIACGSASLWKCNECGELFLEDFYYCPNCGARMGVI